MSTTQMLYALIRVNELMNGPWPPSPEALAKVKAQVAEAVAAGMDTAQRIQRAAARRRDGVKRGAPPSTRYEVDVTNYAPAICLGGAAAAERVNEILAQHGQKKRLTVNNLTTTIATRGGWWTNVDTDSGTITIGVRRLPDAENSA